MKNIMKNKKGFTLIELLAVIVILAILVMVAIPAVTKYLTSARTSAYVTNAKEAIQAVRNDVVYKGAGDVVYSLNGETTGTESLNALLEKKLTQSSFGADYIESSCVSVDQQKKLAAGTDNQYEYTYEYKMCLIDNNGNGFTWTAENEITEAKIQVGSLKGTTCKCTE